MCLISLLFLCLVLCAPTRFSILSQKVFFISSLYFVVLFCFSAIISNDVAADQRSELFIYIRPALFSLSVCCLGRKATSSWGSGCYHRVVNFSYSINKQRDADAVFFLSRFPFRNTLTSLYSRPSACPSVYIFMDFPLWCRPLWILHHRSWIVQENLSLYDWIKPVISYDYPATQSSWMENGHRIFLNLKKWPAACTRGEHKSHN